MKIISDDTENGNAVNDDVDLETITMPLMLMKTHFLNALTMLAEDPQMEVSTEDVDTLRSEFNKLLAASHIASATVLKQDRSEVVSKISAKTPFEPGAVSQSSISDSKKRYHKQEQNLPVKRRRLLLTEDTNTGHITIRTHNGSNLDSQTESKAYGALFIPLQSLCQIGVYLEFKKIMRAANNPVVSRYIRTFNVTKSNSAAFIASYRNDVSKLQSLFSAREASPWDRDENGNGLIYV